MEVRGNPCQNLLAVASIMIQMYLTKKEGVERMRINIDQRNQAKNQEVDEEIHLAVTVVVKREVRDRVPVVVIHISQERQKSQRNTKEGIKNENEEKIRHPDTRNPLTKENRKSPEDLGHPVDDNIYKFRCFMFFDDLYNCVYITLFNKTYFSKCDQLFSYNIKYLLKIF